MVRIFLSLTEYAKKVENVNSGSLLSVCLLFLSLHAVHGQAEGSSHLYKTITVSYVVGAQLYNDNFLYNPGFMIQAAAGKQINKDLSAGVGFGYMPLEGEQFAPVFAEITGYRKKKQRTSFIRYQMGYAVGWSHAHSQSELYDLNGGPFLNFGTGRQIAVNDKYSMFFQLSFCHQFAELSYTLFGNQEFTDRLNYDMLHLSLGFILE